MYMWYMIDILQFSHILHIFDLLLAVKNARLIRDLPGVKKLLPVLRMMYEWSLLAAVEDPDTGE